MASPAVRLTLAFVALLGVSGVFGLTKVPLRCDDPAFPPHGALTGHPGVTVCDQTESCWLPVAAGREACFYVCGDKGNGLGRRGYICNQKPPLQVTWAPAITAFHLPFVEVNSGGVVTGSQALGGGVPTHPNGGTDLYAVRFQESSGAGSGSPTPYTSDVARAQYTFSSPVRTVERFYVFLYSELPHSSANVRILDSTGRVIVRFGFDEFATNYTAGGFGVNVGGEFIAAATISKWHSVEFDINFVKKEISHIKVIAWTGNTPGTEHTRNIVIPFENTAASNFGKIELYQRYRPLGTSQVGWANFVLFDPKRPQFSETGTKYKPSFLRNLKTVQDLENLPH